MSINTISAGQKGWVNILNNNFAELAGNDSDWQQDGIVGVNGFDASNVRYRTSNLNVGGKTLRITQVGGWITIPALKTGESRVIIKIPNIVPDGNYFTSVGSIARSSTLVTDDGKPSNGIALTQIYEMSSFDAYLHYLLIYD